MIMYVAIAGFVGVLVWQYRRDTSAAEAEINARIDARRTALRKKLQEEKWGTPEELFGSFGRRKWLAWGI